jgi:hypothetical protein
MCRFAVKQEMATVPIVNLLDMHIISVGGSARADNLFKQAGRIINAWHTNIRTLQSNDLSLKSVDWIDFNSLDGAVGSRSTTDTTSWPANGTGASATFPTFLALRITKALTAVRGARAGRMFLAGLSEEWSNTDDPQNVSAATLATINTNLAAFLTAINSSGGGIDPDYESHLSVIHRPETVPATNPSHSTVNNLIAQARLSHQVRRK